jgi:branched-chain amino acid aminotransferase
MVNHDGTLYAEDAFFLNHNNRGLRYGDALFETIRALDGRLVFWEDHYLRLMSSMRLLRMEIPMDFSMEFLEGQIKEILEENNLTATTAGIRFTVYRKDGGFYLPATREVSYIIEVSPLETPFYVLSEEPYEIELYKDFHVNHDVLSTLKTNNRLVHITGSIFGDENGYQNCLLLNQEKMITGALNGNLFLVFGNTFKTPPLTDGCLNGIIRKKIIEILRQLDEYEIEEQSVSPFELQKADELFVTNSIMGIRPVTKYRKAEYKSVVARKLLGKLNARARLLN